MVEGEGEREEGDNREEEKEKKKTEVVTVLEKEKTKRLILSGKNLQEIPSKCWENPWHEINLSSNSLSSLPDHLAMISSSLTNLILSRNNLTKLPETIGYLSKVKMLDLSRNKLTTLPEKLGLMANLQNLILIQNDLIIIEDKCFRRGMKIQSLLLSFNHLTRLPSSFNFLNELQVLSLANNKISSLKELFECLPPSLLELDLSSNQISIVPEEINRFQQLTRLWLNKNNIKTIVPELSLPALREFDLSYNYLQELPNSMNFPNLQVFNLSYNHFRFLPLFLCELEGLQQLNISFNCLFSLPERFSMILESLRSLKLEGNAWNFNFSALENSKNFEGEKMEDFWEIFSTCMLDLKSEEWRKEEDKGYWTERYSVFHGKCELFGEPPRYLHNYFFGQKLTENSIQFVHTQAFERLVERQMQIKHNSAFFSFSRGKLSPVNVRVSQHCLRFSGKRRSFHSKKSVVSSYMENVQFTNEGDQIVLLSIRYSNKLTEELTKTNKPFTFSVSRYNTTLPPGKTEIIEFQLMPLKSGQVQFMFWVDIHPLGGDHSSIPLRHFMWVDVDADTATSLHEISYDYISNGKVIARGGEAEISIVEVEKSTPLGFLVGPSTKQVAVKRFFFPEGILDSLKPADIQTLQGIQSFRNEIKISCSCYHPNIVEAIALCCEPPHLCLITEFFPHGDLSRVLTNFDDFPKISACLLTKYAWDAAEALNCLHRNGIIHNDIKAANCFVTSFDLNSPVHLKLGDFGVSTMAGGGEEGNGEGGKRAGEAGTIFWMAPEVMSSEKPPSPCSDVYSFGVLMWEIFARSCDPFPLLEHVFKVEIIQQICDGKRPSSQHLSPNTPLFMTEILRKCLNGQPHRRPNVENILFRFQEEWLATGEKEEWGIGKGKGVGPWNEGTEREKGEEGVRGGERTLNPRFSFFCPPSLDDTTSFSSSPILSSPLSSFSSSSIPCNPAPPRPSRPPQKTRKSGEESDGEGEGDGEGESGEGIGDGDSGVSDGETQKLAILADCFPPEILCRLVKIEEEVGMEVKEEEKEGGERGGEEKGENLKKKKGGEIKEEGEKEKQEQEAETEISSSASPFHKRSLFSPSSSPSPFPPLEPLFSPEQENRDMFPRKEKLLVSSSKPLPSSSPSSPPSVMELEEIITGKAKAQALTTSTTSTTTTPSSTPTTIPMPPPSTTRLAAEAAAIALTHPAAQATTTQPPPALQISTTNTSPTKSPPTPAPRPKTRLAASSTPATPPPRPPPRGPRGKGGGRDEESAQI